MKKLLIAALLVLSLFMVDVYAQQSSSAQSSGLKIADAVVCSGRCRLTGVLVLSDGSNDATVDVYDSATITTTGTLLFSAKVAAASNFGGATWEVPIRAATGIYADVTGTGASFIVYYDKIQ